MRRMNRAPAPRRATGADGINRRYVLTSIAAAASLLGPARALAEAAQAANAAPTALRFFSKAEFELLDNVSSMMTNLYPFLLAGPALKHERIPHFPDVSGYADTNPENCVLTAHCGYFGLLPPSFATEWTARPKVLAIVDENAHAVDARLPEGPVTLAKLHPSLGKLTAVEGTLAGYAQFPGSDCLNGGVIHVPDGHRLVRQATSHHYIVTTGHNLNDMRMAMGVFGVGVEELGT